MGEPLDVVIACELQDETHGCVSSVVIEGALIIRNEVRLSKLVVEHSAQELSVFEQRLNRLVCQRAEHGPRDAAVANLSDSSPTSCADLSQGVAFCGVK